MRFALLVAAVALLAACPGPGPIPPTPTPSISPTIEPTPTPTPTATPTPSTWCPKIPSEGALVSLNNKAYGGGWDSTVWVWGDPEFCRLVHGVPVQSCHLEGWAMRTQCEEELLGGCPVWQFSINPSGAGAIVCHDDHNAPASCDHFGSTNYRDDPQTPTTGDTLETLNGFEGRPLVCGLQRDEFGPKAGHYAIAHGKGYVRACPTWATLTSPSAGNPGSKPSGPCGPWRPFDK